MIIEIGKMLETTIFLAIAALTVYIIFKGKTEKFRRLPAVDAMEDMADRCSEMDRPYYFSPGDQPLSGWRAPMTIAGLNILRYLAGICFERGVKILAHTNQSELIPLMDGIIRESSLTAGRTEMYSPSQVRFLGGGTAAKLADMKRNKIGCYTAVGGFGGMQCFTELEEAHRVGAIVIGGTARYYHNGNFAIFADYPLFCGDIYAAAADVSDDPKVQSSIISEDIIKLLTVIALIVASIVGAAGLPIMEWLSL